MEVDQSAASAEGRIGEVLHPVRTYASGPLQVGLHVAQSAWLLGPFGTVLLGLLDPQPANISTPDTTTTPVDIR